MLFFCSWLIPGGISTGRPMKTCAAASLSPAARLSRKFDSPSKWIRIIASCPCDWVLSTLDRAARLLFDEEGDDDDELGSGERGGSSLLVGLVFPYRCRYARATFMRVSRSLEPLNQLDKLLALWFLCFSSGEHIIISTIVCPNTFFSALTALRNSSTLNSSTLHHKMQNKNVRKNVCVCEKIKLASALVCGSIVRWICRLQLRSNEMNMFYWRDSMRTTWIGERLFWRGVARAFSGVTASKLTVFVSHGKQTRKRNSDSRVCANRWGRCRVFWRFPSKVTQNVVYDYLNIVCKRIFKGTEGWKMWSVDAP